MWLSDRVAFLPTQRSFPASNGLLLASKDELVLVDAGLDEPVLEALAPHLSRVLVTHFHLDHVAGIESLASVPVTWNALETPVLDPDPPAILDFLEVDGARREPVTDFLDAIYPQVPEPEATFDPGQSLELAGLEVDTIPVFGHSPGHVALAIPSEEILFAVDVEFRGRGPWYGWPHCDPTAFEQAAAALAPRFREAEAVVTSHSKPLLDTERALTELESFVDRFQARDEAVLDALEDKGSRGASIAELVDEVRLFYDQHLDAREHLRWFSRVMTELHLERLAGDGRARQV